MASKLLQAVSQNSSLNSPNQHDILKALFEYKITMNRWKKLNEAIKSESIHKNKLWNSSFIRVFIYAVLCTLTMSVSNTVLPLYVINELGYSNAESGLLGTVFTIACMICRFTTGGLADRLGRKKMLIAGALLVGVSLFCMGLTSAFMVILVFKAIQGIGHSFDSTASNAAASDVIPPERMGEGMSYYGLTSTISSAIGPTLSLALMAVAVAPGKDNNYSMPLMAAGVLGIIAAVIALTLNYEKGAVRKTERTKFRISDYIEKSALMPAALQMLSAFGMGATVFNIVFANAMGFKSIQAYFIVTAVVALVTRLVMGKRMDTIAMRKLAIIPLLAYMVSFVVLSVTLNEAVFMVCGIISGIYGGLLMPTFNSLALKLAPENRRGAASATFWLGFDAGIAIGQIVFGAVIDAFGFAVMYMSLAAYLAVFGVITFFALRGKGALESVNS